jgi:Ceramidase
MNDYIDIYCERLGPGLWAEPLNAVTNGAFLMAAYFALALARGDRGGLVLAGLIACIGVGSGLFHTFATPMTQMMDVIPILLFQVTFLALYSLRVMGLGRVRTFALFAAFMVCSILAEGLPREFLNESGGYIPALVFVLGFGIWHWRHAARERSVLLMAAGVFVISLTFRSIDMAVCESFAIGTHFLWHCLNATVLYLCVRGYVGAKKL